MSVKHDQSAKVPAFSTADVSVETRHHVHMDVKASGGQFLSDVLDTLFFEEGVNDFEVCDGTPASGPSVSFWCSDRKQSVQVANRVLSMIYGDRNISLQ